MAESDAFINGNVIIEPLYKTTVLDKTFLTSYTPEQLQRYWDRKIAIAYNKANNPKWVAWFSNLNAWKQRKLANYELRNEVYWRGKQQYKYYVAVQYRNLVYTRALSAKIRKNARDTAYEAYILYVRSVKIVRSKRYKQSSPVYTQAIGILNGDKAVQELNSLSPLKPNTVVPFYVYLAAAVKAGFKYNTRTEDYNRLYGIFKYLKFKSFQRIPKVPPLLKEPRPEKPFALPVLSKPVLTKNFCNDYYVRSVVFPWHDLVVAATPAYSYTYDTNSYVSPWVINNPWALQIDGKARGADVNHFFYKALYPRETIEQYQTWLSSNNNHMPVPSSEDFIMWHKIHDGQVSNLHNIVLAKIGAKFRGHGFNAGNALIEADETFKFLFSSVKNLGNAIASLRSGHFVKAAKDVGLDFSSVGKFRQTIANADLMYAYALTPLISDVQAAAEAVAVKVGGLTADGMSTDSYDGYRLRSSKSYISTHEYDIEDSSYLGRIKITRKSTYRMIVQLGRGGFSSIPTIVLNDPFQALWEGTFMSFVVDWFYPIQQFLEAMWTVSGNVNIVKAMYSIKDTYTAELLSFELRAAGPIADLQGLGHIYRPHRVYTVSNMACARSMSFRRASLIQEELMPHIPQVRPLSDALSVRHIANGMALLSNAGNTDKAANRASSRIAYLSRQRTRRR